MTTTTTLSANELRIGNWVKFSNPSALRTEGITQIKGVVPNGVYYHDESEQDAQFWKLQFTDLEPIPLTPEILEKCDIKTIPVFWIEEDCSIDLEFQYINGPDTAGRDEVWVYFNNAKLQSCEYLHQLQNLYFAMTGTELKIEL